MPARLTLFRRKTYRLGFYTGFQMGLADRFKSAPESLYLALAPNEDFLFAFQSVNFLVVIVNT